jgi:hypothetical protein
MPLVATELHREFGRPPVTIEQPEMVVAEGAVLVGRAVQTRGGRPVSEKTSGSGSLALPVSPATPAQPAPSVSGPPVSPGPSAIAQVSPGAVPLSPTPVPPVPPVQRRPVSPPPVPYPPRPVYLPPPQPQVVFQPVYALPPMMPMLPPVRLRPPWSIRWPAGFMTTYSVLLFVLTAGLLLFAGVIHLGDPSTGEFTQAQVDEITEACLQWAGICAVLATLLVNGARRLRRPAAGHLWYPLALVLIVAVSNLGLIQFSQGLWPLVAVPAVVFALSAAALVLPGSQRWVRRPPKPPSLKAIQSDTGPARPPTG